MLIDLLAQLTGVEPVQPVTKNYWSASQPKAAQARTAGMSDERVAKFKRVLLGRGERRVSAIAKDVEMFPQNARRSLRLLALEGFVVRVDSPCESYLWGDE